MRTQLKVARIEQGFTQGELAAQIGVTQQTIAKWELGVTTPSQFTHIRKLESTLQKPAPALFPDVFCTSVQPVAE